MKFPSAVIPKSNRALQVRGIVLPLGNVGSAPLLSSGIWEIKLESPEISSRDSLMLLTPSPIVSALPNFRLANQGEGFSFLWLSFIYCSDM